MAPKVFPSSRQPSKEKEEKEEPSEEEEEEEEEEEIEGKEELEDPSEEEKEALSHDDEEEQEEEEEPLSEDERGNKTPISVSKFDKNDGSDSESESDGGSPSDYKLQPISKTKSTGKRVHQESENGKESVTSSKKSRIEEKKGFSSSTPGGITRLWSNEDEIAVLNGMIDFRDVKGLDPNADMVAFYSFIKGKLKVDFSRDQLRTKINRMKKRFLNALKKGGDGSDPVFSKPHEDMAFELSKKIWGGNSKGSKNAVPASGVHENGKKEIVKAKKKIEGDEKEVVTREKDGEEGDFWSKYPFLSSSFAKMVGDFPSLSIPGAGMSFMKEKLSLIGNAKAKELEEKWKKLNAEENELNYKMLMLTKEQVRMAFDQ